jgi:hypothetical protein
MATTKTIEVLLGPARRRPTAGRSGQARIWERKTREAIGLLAKIDGYKPEAVPKAKPPGTIEAEAVVVPEDERAK